MKQDHFNYAPEGWVQITEEEFSRIFFCYCFKDEIISKQIHHDNDGNRLEYKGSARLFEIEYPDWEDMGVAMVNSRPITFYKFGTEERWKKNQSNFAAQFAGDNS